MEGGLAIPPGLRFVSSVSIAEIAVKLQSGRIRMRAADLEQLVGDFALKHIPFEHRHADRMRSLPLHHHDLLTG
jgi:PIN domain nuclease of toxin-antitoxin system